MRKTVLEIYKKLLDAYGYQNWWPIHENNKDKLAEICIGAVLTQNTSWKNVEKALENLINENILNFYSLSKIDENKLKIFIKPAGFYNQKAKAIIELSKLFIAKNPYEIEREELLKIKGIGKETADSILLYGLDKPYFVVDSYTKRIFYRLGIIESENISYDKVQRFIMEKIEKDISLYKEFHALIVVHCKNVCKKVPLCKKCVFYNQCNFNLL